ncbi:ras-related and estrogen-regulated growth inhibitor [Lingula anatina]|uniref:small monomeric GTPase n=1 Tax=Lingula anatina TaxID=7574 RepID=A0A1S3KGW6_LINAN|nr:ras-related and estrogen-regulated growth inhibitor [Lingula anatina]XP_013421733.1 ras-related and estrogen-regulated growth inhibitor [Lingula anatina]XP_013421734.1 ras-related and estrogen-regulated growth inhibitor [Lingula anatina]|eukprot:XP_013421732.1 ras-related and estrogen-regulated growth inhibitor [Lingula anatina]
MKVTQQTTTKTKMSSPILRKLSGSNSNKTRTLRIIILGQGAVGKSALTVRYITRKFIGDYDPTLEQVYSFQTVVDNDHVMFEILDTAGQDEEHMKLEENIRWADGFILMYSITDRVSFEECARMKFLINFSKRQRKVSTGALAQSRDLPVVLVGNKSDLTFERMVSFEEGEKFSFEIGCTNFHEISVRESYESVRCVFENLYRDWKSLRKSPGSLRRHLPSVTSRPRERAATVSSSSSEDFDIGVSQFKARRGAMTGTVPQTTDVVNGGNGIVKNNSISRRFYNRVFRKDSFLQLQEDALESSANSTSSDE